MQRIPRSFHAAVALSLLATPPTALAEADGPSGMTPAQVAKQREVKEVAIAPGGGDEAGEPGGRAIAYVLEVPRKPLKDPNGPAWQELHVVRPDGTSRGYVTGEVRVQDIQWTPDGEAISFLMAPPGASGGGAAAEGALGGVASSGERAGGGGPGPKPALYRIPVDGGEARKLIARDTPIVAHDWAPSPSEDRRRVAFISPAAKDEAHRKLEKKGFNQRVFEEDARSKRVRIAELPAVGEAPEDPAKVEARELELDGSASEIHWGPEGERIALALAPTPLVDDHYMARRFHVVDADEGEVVAEVDHEAKLGPLAWSPDGERLAFVAGEGPHDLAAGRLFVVDADEGGDPTEVLPELVGHVRAIDWKNEGTIAWMADHRVRSLVGTVGADGGDRREVLAAEDGPVLEAMDLADDGATAALIGQTPSHPAEVYRMELGQSPRRMTTSNPWLDEVELAEQEKVTWQARDGKTIEGILVRPLGGRGGERVPLVVVVHGGPESHVPHGWVTSYASPGQVGAARGFAVLYPNYRGSTGRSVAFSKAGQGDPAGREFDDIVDGVEAMVDRGLVDGDRVGITGGSYGGYASAWAATKQTEHFAASAMFVGIADQVSKIGETDIPKEMRMVHFREPPWEHWDLFLKRSPIYHAGKSETATLILHGQADPRVNPSQSLELYRHLKMRTDTPVRYVQYPGEGHGNRRAASRFDLQLRLLRWMEHFAAGDGEQLPDERVDYREALPWAESKDDEEEEDDAQGAEAE